MTQNCIFCKIISKELPATRIYEDDEFIVFHNLNPSTRGHSLLVPKEHSKDLLEMNPNLGSKAMALIQKIGNAMITGLEADGFNVIVNTMPAAGQVIFHTHIHIVPRYSWDGLKHWKSEESTEEERLINTQKIVSALQD